MTPVSFSVNPCTRLFDKTSRTGYQSKQGQTESYDLLNYLFEEVFHYIFLIFFLGGRKPLILRNNMSCKGYSKHFELLLFLPRRLRF